MGYVDAGLLSRQRIFTARQNNRPVAFITFLIGNEKWTLDIIRSDTSCPDGTVHALVYAAIEAAKAEGIPELSLAAAPGFIEDKATRTDWAISLINKRYGNLNGLTQFKKCFAPSWQPYYIIASSPFTLIGAVSDIWGLIHHPLSAHQESSRRAHNDYGLYEFDSPKETCHAR